MFVLVVMAVMVIEIANAWTQQLKQQRSSWYSQQETFNIIPEKTGLKRLQLKTFFHPFPTTGALRK